MARRADGAPVINPFCAPVRALNRPGEDGAIADHVGSPCRPVPETEDWMSLGYHFRLQLPDGSPADPPTYKSSTLVWHQGDVIPLGRGRRLRVLGVRDDDADQPPVLVVEDLFGAAASDAA